MPLVKVHLELASSWLRDLWAWAYVRSAWVGNDWVMSSSMLATPCRTSSTDTLTGVRLRAGEPGNEAGYVVAMTDDTLATPYKVVPGTRVRLESAYDGTSKRLGVMGCARPGPAHARAISCPAPGSGVCPVRPRATGCPL